jgi:hypothetical protein
VTVPSSARPFDTDPRLSPECVRRGYYLNFGICKERTFHPRRRGVGSRRSSWVGRLRCGRLAAGWHHILGRPDSGQFPNRAKERPTHCVDSCGLQRAHETATGRPVCGITRSGPLRLCKRHSRAELRMVLFPRPRWQTRGQQEIPPGRSVWIHDRRRIRRYGP